MTAQGFIGSNKVDLLEAREKGTVKGDYELFGKDGNGAPVQPARSIRHALGKLLFDQFVATSLLSV